MKHALAHLDRNVPQNAIVSRPTTLKNPERLFVWALLARAINAFNDQLKYVEEVENRDDNMELELKSVNENLEEWESYGRGKKNQYLVALKHIEEWEEYGKESVKRRGRLSG